MAAFASLVCLSNLMVQMKNHPRFSTFFDETQIQYLAQNVNFLLDFVESYNSRGVGDLEKRIASAAYAAASLTEKFIEAQIIGGSSERKRLAYLLDLHKLIVDMDFIKEEVMEVKQNKQPTNSMTSKPLTNGRKPTMVGFDGELIQLMDLLTRQHPGRIIIPIVGMGGIGKTTLAQNAYEHLLIKQNFDLCLWATISQQYSVTEILLQLLSCTQAKFTSESTMHELGDQLYKDLFGRRYLIVLDDMWGIEAWDKIKVFFPNNGKTSRVVVTTRLSNVASRLNSSCIKMKFLNEDKSWKLLCEKAFGEEECPHELEEIGKEIVKKCKGLPLSIVVIGGHLRNCSRAKESWLEVANDINSVLDEDEQCLSILNLSYSNLPAHLKPCFLSIGIILEEDKKIDGFILVKLWVAGGFLKQSETHSLEDVAWDYLDDLFDRNLILVTKRDQGGGVETLRIHDLLRDLCLMVAEEEKFVWVLKSPPRHLKSCSSDLRLSQIHLVDTFTIEDEFDVVYPRTMFQQVCLRYLHCTIYKTAPRFYLHSSVFLLWNLQTLIMDADANVRIMAPSEIWEMPSLRHLLIRPRVCVPDPPPSDLVLHNLTTLLNVENLRLSEEVCKRIPNITRLKLWYDDEASSCSYYCLHNLHCFKQLGSLSCDFAKMLNWSDSTLNLPSSLYHLSLRSRYLNWECLTMIATMVPRLKVLQLQFLDSNIGQFKGEFPCLKSLVIICDCDSTEWNAKKSHFPVLQNLILKRYRLAEIPPGIVEIPTLTNIYLVDCSASAAVSVVKILMEQEELGDEGFELRLNFSQSDEERFWEMVEEEDLTSSNVFVNESHRTNTTIRMKSRT